MSTLEKNLYKRITIAAKPQKESVGSAYRGFSTVNNNVEGFALYASVNITNDSSILISLNLLVKKI